MQAMSGFPWVLAVAVHLLFSVAMGVHQALFAWLVRRTQPVAQRAPWHAIGWALALATLYAAIEFVVPYLFPWFLGNAFYTTGVWIQAADVLGIAGVSLLAMACNVLIALGLVDARLRKPATMALAVLLVAWSGYGFLRLHQIEGVTPRRIFRAVLVQADATLQEKLGAGRARLPMLDRHEQMTRALDRRDVDLIVWPEGSLPFFWIVDHVGPDGAPEGTRTKANPLLVQAKRRTLDLVKFLDRPLLFGSLRRLDRLWEQEARNSAFLVRPDGQEWVYDKRILLPFGEYLPGSTLIPALKESIPGVSHMDSGTTSGLIDVAGTRLLVNICYEALFPAFLRAEGSDADVIANLTNDIWFGPLPAPELHLMVQQARAVELRRPLLRSTVTGITAMVDALGVIQGRTTLHEQAVRRFDVPVRDLASPYRLWGDAPMWLLTLLAAAWSWWRIRRPV
jgi:apolipoprotein N-acyltransferase